MTGFFFHERPGAWRWLLFRNPMPSLDCMLGAPLSTVQCSTAHVVKYYVVHTLILVKCESVLGGKNTMLYVPFTLFVHNILQCISFSIRLYSYLFILGRRVIFLEKLPQEYLLDTGVLWTIIDSVWGFEAFPRRLITPMLPLSDCSYWILPSSLILSLWITPTFISIPRINTIWVTKSWYLLSKHSLV